jgi:hypothetical protein
VSLFIKVEDVTAVLLSDGWHEVDWSPTGRLNDNAAVSTFGIDSFDLVNEYWNYDERRVITFHSGGVGFSFYENGVAIAGPIVSICALRFRQRGTPRDPAYRGGEAGE